MSEEPAARPKESPPAPRAAPREVWKKGGRLLSVLLAVNVLLLACTLISGGAFNKVAVYDTDVFALLTAMMLLATLWILFYLLRTLRRPDAVPYRDKHAGPIWLRGAVQSGRRGGGGVSQGAGGRGWRGGLWRHEEEVEVPLAGLEVAEGQAGCSWRRGRERVLERG